MDAQPHADGLVIFMRGLPKQVGEAKLRETLLPYLSQVGIGTNGFDLQKPKGRGISWLHVFSAVKGEALLDSMAKYPSTLGIGRHTVVFEREDNQDGGAMVRDRKFIEQVERNAHNAELNDALNAMTLHGSQRPEPANHQATARIFDLIAVTCGNWSYGPDGAPIFVAEYTSNKPGKLLVGMSSVVATFNHDLATNGWTHRIDLEWDCVDTVYAQRGNFSSLIVTCKHMPKMYRRVDMKKKARIPSLDPVHGQVAGTCFSYELVLESHDSLHPVRKLIEHTSEGPTLMRVHTRSIVAKVPQHKALQELNEWLSHSQLRHPIIFQAMKMALNGHLTPQDIMKLMETVQDALAAGHTTPHCAEALRQFDRDLPWASPQTPHRDTTPQAMRILLQEIIANGNERNSWSRTANKNNTLAMVHHATVTPVGIYLDGPELEVTNRVLRKYSENIDSFLRVTFCDEDGEQLQFRFDTTRDEIYDKYKTVLDDCIPIGGRKFQFLGFSQSSLRSQTAWFMAPFPTDKYGTLITPSQAIEDLGDFSHLRSPAKCAARIGQAFTDTNGFITVQANAEFEIDDVERNGRVFSDGCGIMSKDVAFNIGMNYERLVMKEKPTVLQIRYRGAKGVLSIDPRMGPGNFAIRPSMRKFETAPTDTYNLEICGMADKARPMYLNRGLIKVLEDLDVPDDGFLQLANETIQRLQNSTSSVAKIAKLLEVEKVGTAAGFSNLVMRMDQINIDVRSDGMLCAAVEVAAFCRLRAMKYKGRMLVEKGVKLMGIMDETGYLQEGQIHIAWIDERGRRVIHKGKIAVTRSPTNHPGDVQLATAVDVPKESALRELYNCVIFSQYGDRDLPSQLGGGDLDGDLYDVFWDERIMPSKIFMPAEYPRQTPIDIGRTITTQDISQHFIDFMKNDNVGLLSHLLLQVSDRVQLGTRDHNCIAICELISTALDYPKTGHIADMKSLPRFDKSWKPDFMAPGPSAKIEQMTDPLAVVLYEEPAPIVDDPVLALDPEQRKTRYYESPHILGKLYRLIDEKGFYDSLQNTTKDTHRGQSVMDQVLAYARRATKGIQFKQHLAAAREIRIMYEEAVSDISTSFALHPAHPLPEIEVVTGAVLGSIFNRRLKDLATDMKERFGRDVGYIRERIRFDEQGGDGESLPRAVACLYVAVREEGRKMGVGRKGEQVGIWSFAYVAAGVCLEEIERFHGGKLVVGL